MRHLKRQEMPKNWPIPRKGTTYVVKAYSNLDKSVPILIVLRDMLKIARNRKEVKNAIFEKNIIVNGRTERDDKNSMQLFDKISIIPFKKHYQLSLSEKGKFVMEEVKENETNKKIAKIIDKKMLKGKKVQINLSDGRNFLSDSKCLVGDSGVVNFKDKKIEKCLALKENSQVIAFAGKHAGKKGKILKINPERKMVSIEAGKDKINVLIKQIMVIE